MANVVYRLVVGVDIDIALGNLRIRARRAIAANQRFGFPRLAELLADPQFAAVRDFLDSRGVDQVALQAEIDRLWDEAHKPEA